MEKLPYLKDLLQTNIPLTVKITKRLGQYPETDYNTKEPTGRMQTLYNFELLTGPGTGTLTRHYAKEREEETLKVFSAGESLQVVRQEANKDGKRISFLVWTPTDGAEQRLAANPPLQSNLQQTATQREMKDRQEEQAEKSIAISLQGFMQAYVKESRIADDKPEILAEKAVEFAVIAREACLRKAKELHLGIPPSPEPSVNVSDLPF